MRSPPAPSSARTGYVWASATQRRPRSSSAKAIGRTTSGSEAAGFTVNPFGTVIARAASAADRPACRTRSIGGSVGVSAGVTSWRNAGFDSWKRKLSKLM